MKYKEEFINKLNIKNMRIARDKDDKYNLNGFYIVNEEKIRVLDEKKKKELCDKNFYPLITAHVISLSNIQKIGIIK